MKQTMKKIIGYNIKSTSGQYFVKKEEKAKFDRDVKNNNVKDGMLPKQITPLYEVQKNENNE